MHLPRQHAPPEMTCSAQIFVAPFTKGMLWLKDSAPCRAARLSMQGHWQLDEQQDNRSSIGGIPGALLLLMTLFALFLGVFGALYLDRSRSRPESFAARAPAPVERPFPAPASRPAPAPRLEAALPLPDPPPTVSVGAVPAGTTEALPTPAPAADPVPSPIPSAAKPPVEAPATPPTRLAAAPPSSAPGAAPPPNTAPHRAAAVPPPVPSAKPVPPAEPAGYWVEYGAFLGKHYADRLVSRLGKLGLDAVITRTPGRGGKEYYRVRSAGGLDNDAAQAAVRKAHAAVHIAPLLHRARSEDGETAVPRKDTRAPMASRPHAAPRAPAAAVDARPSPAVNDSNPYWVQFGAYAHERLAKHFGEALERAGIPVRIIARRHDGGRVLYHVRSHPLPDDASARALALRAQRRFGTNALIGCAPHHLRAPRSGRVLREVVDQS